MFTNENLSVHCPSPLKKSLSNYETKEKIKMKKMKKNELRIPFLRISYNNYNNLSSCISKTYLY